MMVVPGLLPKERLEDWCLDLARKGVQVFPFSNYESNNPAKEVERKQRWKPHFTRGNLGALLQRGSALVYVSIYERPVIHPTLPDGYMQVIVGFGAINGFFQRMGFAWARSTEDKRFLADVLDELRRQGMREGPIAI